jgi:hypothetical protein
MKLQLRAKDPGGNGLHSFREGGGWRTTCYHCGASRGTEQILEAMQEEYYQRGYYEGLMTGVQRHTWMRDGVTYDRGGYYHRRNKTALHQEIKKS